jgi:hypothetical protein
MIAGDNDALDLSNGSRRAVGFSRLLMLLKGGKDGAFNSGPVNQYVKAGMVDAPPAQSFPLRLQPELDHELNGHRIVQQVGAHIKTV